MKTKARVLDGAFTARELPGGAWSLTDGASTAPESVLSVHITGSASDADNILRERSFSAITVEWPESGGVILTLTAAGAKHTLRARNALIHEPLPRLYESLPLANFDAAAQAFWRRVFRLVRLPGGRYLLGLIARRTRRKK